MLALDPEGHPGAGMHACLDDVLALCRELLSPRLVAEETHAEMVSVQFPGLDGVLPDFGRFSPMDWGLGVELKTDEAGPLDRLADVGRDIRSLRRQRHVPVGRSHRRCACACLTTREFDAWAKEAWPRLSDAIVLELPRSPSTA